MTAKELLLLFDPVCYVFARCEHRLFSDPFPDLRCSTPGAAPILYTWPSIQGGPSPSNVVSQRPQTGKTLSFAAEDLLDVPPVYAWRN